MGEVDDTILHLHELVGRLEVGHHLRAGLLDREPGIRARLGIERAIGLQDVDHRQLLPQADVVIIRVVGGRDLHAAGAHLWLGPFVGDERDRAAEEGELHCAAGAGHRGQPFEAGQELGAAGGKILEGLVDLGVFLGRGGGPLLAERLFGGIERGRRRGMHRHGRVAEERLGPRGRHDHARRLAGLGIDHVVADVPEVALHGLVEDLVVAHGRLQEGVPVHEPLAAADEALLEEPEEGLAHGSRAPLVEREAGAVPIAAGAEVAELPENPLLILLLPGPDPLDEFLAAEVVPRELFLLQEPPLDDRLRGDAGMVGAGHPEREEALHPPRAHEHVLQRVIEGVAEVEGAGDVGRRDHDREDVAAGLGLGVPVAAGVPEAPAAGLRGLVVVLLGQFGH